MGQANAMKTSTLLLLAAGAWLVLRRPAQAGTMGPEIDDAFSSDVAVPRRGSRLGVRLRLPSSQMVARGAQAGSRAGGGGGQGSGGGGKEQFTP